MGCCLKLVLSIYCMSHIAFINSKKNSDFKSPSEERSILDDCNYGVDCFCHLTESKK